MIKKDLLSIVTHKYPGIWKEQENASASHDVKKNQREEMRIMIYLERGCFLLRAKRSDA
jgi:hypothetical protein